MHLVTQIGEFSGVPAVSATLSRFEDADYLAMICHEISTPLTAILGISQILANIECSVQKKKECTEVLRDSSNMLMGLLNNMLDSSKLDNGIVELERIPFDLTKVLEEARNIIAVKAMDKGLKVDMHISKPLPSLFMGDPLRIRQILLNLLGNAIKFTHCGIISLTMTEGAVLNGYSQVCITVADPGIGIEKEQLGNIFGKCTQANPDIGRKYGGSGLGLFISRQLAHLMNGDIIVRSTPGKGSHFIVTLPLMKARTLPAVA
jgi:hypothetical protein